MKTFLLCFTILVAWPILAADEKHSYKPENGFVPDEKTAIAIAIAVWSPIYGQDKIKKEKPFKASLKDGEWQVEGTFHGKGKGGVAIAEISKADARVLRVSHGK